MVQLHPQAPALPHRHGEIEPFVLDPQLVEVAQRLPGEVADLRVVALGLELGDHHDRKDYGVLGETEDRLRVGQENGGVQNERALGLVDS
jgi:hypothetical protein